MHHQKSLDTFEKLNSFIDGLGPTHPLKVAPEYSAAIYKKLARIYCECLCLRKAYDLSK